MARKRERAAESSTPGSLTVAFEKVYRSETTPPLDDFLALGKELNAARLNEFICQTLHGPQTDRAYARGLLYTAARIYEGANPADKPHLEKLIAEVDANNRWLFVRDEIIKFYKMVNKELADRLPPNQASMETSVSESSGLNKTESAVLSIIRGQPKGQGITGKEILKKLREKHINIAYSYLRRHILQKLKNQGVTNHPAAGGYVIS
jgi:hypothetical protein